jgi:hypothetical protein
MWQSYTTNEDILLEIKINTVVKKIQNYRNNCVRHIQRMDKLLHLIMKYQPSGKQNEGQPLKRLLKCKWDWERS